jgi:hypothetical protein
MAIALNPNYALALSKNGKQRSSKNKIKQKQEPNYTT